MQTCGKCGTQFEGKFCPNCGTPAQKFCPNCGEPVGANVKFCSNCGQALSSPPPAPVTEEQASSKPAPLPTEEPHEEPQAPAVPVLPVAEPTHEEPPAGHVPSPSAAPAEDPGNAALCAQARLGQAHRRWMITQRIVRYFLAVALASLFSAYLALAASANPPSSSDTEPLLLAMKVVFGIGSVLAFVFSLALAMGGDRNAYVYGRWVRNDESNWKPQKLKRETGFMQKLLIGALVAVPVSVIGAILLFSFMLPYCGKYSLPSLIPPLSAALILLSVLMSFLGLLLSVFAKPQGEKVVTGYYGRPDPIYEKELPLYDQKEIIVAMNLAKRGDIAVVNRKMDPNCILSIAVAVLYVIVAAIVVPFFSARNIFDLDKLQKIRIGTTTQEEVRELLGDPYTDPSEKESEFRWEYYDDNYQSLLKRAAELTSKEIGDVSDFSDALEESAELLEEMAETEYRYICITFDADKKVTSVLYDSMHNGKQAHSNATAELSRTNFTSAEQLNELTVKIIYTDGSYINQSLSAYEVFHSGGTNYTLAFSDPFGTPFREYVTAAEGVFPEN